MANFDGYPVKPVIDRWGGQVEWDDPVTLPLGVGQVVRNMTFADQSVRTRAALVRTILTGQAQRVSGLSLLKFTGSDPADVPAKYPLIYDQGGNLWYESPLGSGTLVPLASSHLTAGLHAQIEKAYDNAYIAQSDLIEGQAKPLVFSGKRQDLWPLSDLPLGSAWEADHVYVVGDIVSPTTSNGMIYRAEAVAGDQKSGAVEPVWPGDNATVVDDQVTWRECTPFIGTTLPVPDSPAIAKVAAGGAWALGRDVYVLVTLVNGEGETDATTQIASVAVNTALNDAVRVTKPAYPSWDAGLAAPYKITGWNVYVADVATGAAEPGLSAYKKSNGVLLTAGDATYDITAAAAGAAAPAGNDAWLAPAGNICAGNRWMVFLFENLNGAVGGITDAIPVFMSPVDEGRQMFVAKLPVGRANTGRRILAFTAAGDQSGRAGRYFYVPQDDHIYPGDSPVGASLDITKTIVPDNVTTSLRLNFADFYLTNLSTEITIEDHFNRQQVEGASDVYYSKALNRLILTGVPGYPSGFWVSGASDPEAYALPFCELEVSENDGDRTVCWREIGTIQYALKENAGYKVDGSGTVPQKWPAPLDWAGSGPCGPRAVDCTDTFMIYAHTSGMYLKTNATNPVFISPELVKTWARLNRAYKHLIQVKIDQDAKEVHVLMPVDGATRNNLRIRLKVRQWDQLTSEPIVLARSGGFVANSMGRKWSVEPLDVSVIDIWDRDLAVSIDQRIDHRQVVYGSSLAEGLIRMERPDWYKDQNAAGDDQYIDYQYDTTYTPNPKTVVFALGGVTVSAKGKGNLLLYALAHSEGAPPELTDKRKFVLESETFDTHHDAPAKSLRDEHWGLRITGDGVAGSWAELHDVLFHLRVAYTSRKA